MSKKENEIYLIAGTIPLKAQDEGKVLNTTLAFDPKGDRIGRYDKIQLFGFQTNTERYQESETIEAGEVPSLLKISIGQELWTFGLSICYDLRFPVFARNVEDYDVLIYVVNWPKPRINAWDILLKARAVENMSYAIGVNRIGMDENELEYVGHSQAVDFLGNYLLEPQETDGVFIVELDKEKLLETRSKLAFLEDKDQFRLL